MEKTSNLYIAIPVFNERENIKDLFNSLDRLREKLSSAYSSIEIVIVDDGSNDNTVRLIEANKSLKLTLLRHEKNIGPGASFGTAFEYLSSRINSEDWVVTMEGDNTSRLNVLEHMLMRKNEGYDVVLASPFIYGGSFENIPWFRIFVSNVLVVLIKIIMDLHGILVFSSFFRIYGGGIVLKMQRRFGKRIIESSGFEHALELIAKLVIVGARISEVEMNLNWENRKGKSKMRFFKTILGYLKIMLKFNCKKLKRDKLAFKHNQ
ncbi:glycosyltransferase family 2 protein [Candidatus Omnitrophota bacterium]